MFDKLKESINKDKEKYTGDIIEDIKILGNEFREMKKGISMVIKDINKKEIVEGEKIIDLSYINKKEFESHKITRTRSKEFLLQEEEILLETVKIDEVTKVIKSYFITDKRVLTIIPQYKNKKVSVESVYYDNISSIMFVEGEKDTSSLVISYKGRQQANMNSKMVSLLKSLVDVRTSNFDDYTIYLYSDIAKEIYTIINSHLYK